MLKNIFYGWWVVFASFIIFFYVVGTVHLGFTVFIDPIVAEFGWSYTSISLAVSLRWLEFGVFAPLIGLMVDRFGSRRLLFGGSILIVLGFFILSTIQTLTMFYVGSFILGLGTCCCTVTVLTPAVADWFKKDIGKALGIMLSGGGAGGLLLPLIGFLIIRFGWRHAFLFLGVGMLIVGIPATLVVHPQPDQDDRQADKTKSDATDLPEKRRNKDFSLRSALRTRVFWHLSIAESIRLMVLAALMTHIMPYLSSSGFSRMQTTSVATLIPLLSIAGRLLAGWLGDRYNHIHIMTGLYLLGGLSIFIFANVNTEWLLYPFLILFPLSWGAAVLQGAILRERFGRFALGSIVGIFGTIITIPRMLGPAIAGWVYDTFGQYKFAWLFFAALFSISIILMLTVEPQSKKE